MRRKRLFLLFAGIFLFTGIMTASAETECGNQAAWNPVTPGPITTWPAPLCAKGKLFVQPFFYYIHTHGVFDSEGDYHSLDKGEKKSQGQQQLLLEYGVADKLEVDMHAAYSENYAKEGDGRAHSDGFTDTWFSGRYCLREESATLPCVTALFQLKTPTGKYQHGKDSKLDTDIMGTGSWDPGLGVIMTKRYKPFVLHTDLIYTVPQKVRVDNITRYNAPYINYEFAVEYVLPKGFNLLGEVNGFCQGDRREFGKAVPASDSKYLIFAPGIGWSCDKVQMLLEYQYTAFGTNADGRDSVVFTIMHTF